MIVQTSARQDIFSISDDAKLYLQAIPRKDIARMKDSIIAISMEQDTDGSRDIKLRQNTFEYELVKASITGWSGLFKDESKEEEYKFSANEKTVGPVLNGFDDVMWDALVTKCKELSNVKSLTEDE